MASSSIAEVGVEGPPLTDAEERTVLLAVVVVVSEAPSRRSRWCVRPLNTMAATMLVEALLSASAVLPPTARSPPTIHDTTAASLIANPSAEEYEQPLTVEVREEVAVVVVVEPQA